MIAKATIVSSGVVWCFLVPLLLSQVESTVVHVPTKKISHNDLRGGASTSEVNPKVFRRFADDNRMPSLFVPEESIYDRYAACLAATEGLRRIRDRDLAEEFRENGFRREPGGGLSEGEKRANSQYVQNSGKVVRALGMTVQQFNELGKRITQDEKLKGKIMEQAYLYRLAATISMDRMPVIEDAATSAALQAYRRDKVDMFCDSMWEIEKLREDQIERLKRSLRVDKFPGNVNISDPGLLPFLSPKVRAVVEAFPFQAEEIVKKHGLQSEEFNKMLDETKSNPIFRWKIQKQLKNAEHNGGNPTDANSNNLGGQVPAVRASR